MRPVTASLVIAAPAAEVLEQFLDVSSMSVWWGVARGLVDPRPGGVWALGWDSSPAGFRSVTTGRIVIHQPGSRLHISDIVHFNPGRGVLGPQQLFLSTAFAAGGCEIRVKQDGYGDGADWDWLRRTQAEAWPKTLAALKRRLETGAKPRP